MNICSTINDSNWHLLLHLSVLIHSHKTKILINEQKSTPNKEKELERSKNDKLKLHKNLNSVAISTCNANKNTNDDYSAEKTIACEIELTFTSWMTARRLALTLLLAIVFFAVFSSNPIYRNISTIPALSPPPLLLSLSLFPTIFPSL